MPAPAVAVRVRDLHGTRTMFITHPQHQFPLPLGLAEPHETYWRVMRLSLRRSWFILTVEEQVDGMALLESIGVATERDLVEMIRKQGGTRVVALAHVAPDRGTSDVNWRSRVIREVWTGTAPSGACVLMFSDEEGTDFVDDLNASVVDEVNEWELLVQVAPPS